MNNKTEQQATEALRQLVAVIKNGTIDDGTFVGDIRKALANAETFLRAADAPKWKPAPGRFFIGPGGDIVLGAGSPETVAFGASYMTRSHTADAQISMRRHNRMLAYVAEHAPDCAQPAGVRDVWDAGEHEHWSVRKSVVHGNWEDYQVDFFAPGIVYMPHATATALADKLNRGEVVF